MSGNESTRSESLIFRQNVLDALSPSFCGAKWYESTIWLNRGLTASCHHTRPHAISRDEIQNNPSALHNTGHKMAMRQLMQAGKRPEECDYCWKLEDMGVNTISDRVFKSQRLHKNELKVAHEQDSKTPINPSFLEIAFDRICQFACMYCSPSYSTTWEREVTLKGAYKNLLTDVDQHYKSAHESEKIDDKGAAFVEAFWRWWPDLVQSLKTLRITGGEPLLSPHLWTLLKRQDLRDKRINLAVNSNLGVDQETIQKFLDAIDGCAPVEIFTSGEAFGDVGEYVRDGKKWPTWMRNINAVLEAPNIKSVCISFSINAIAAASLLPTMDYIIELRKRYGRKRVKLFWNIVHFPQFQSVSVLPVHLRRDLSLEIAEWLSRHAADLEEFEYHSIERFLQYLVLEDRADSAAEKTVALQKDLKSFIVQYDQRRKKSYQATLPQQMVEWLDTLEPSQLTP